VRWVCSKRIRWCGPPGISFEEVVNSPYFSEGSKAKPKSKIQYKDGISGTIGWGDSKIQIADKDIVPFETLGLLALLRFRVVAGGDTKATAFRIAGSCW
jgi:hypothetical protein